jgi:transposase
LTGYFHEHHAFLCRTMLARIDAVNAVIDVVTGEIDREIEPLKDVVDRLGTIPGVKVRVAQAIIAEVGTDMDRFPTAGHLASWAGLCPGNNESAGKHFSGRTRKGDRWLRGALGEAAAAASGANNTYLQAQFRRLAGRRGKKRALVAVAHSIIIAAWYMIKNKVDYQDLGPLHFLQRVHPARQANRLVTQLQQLGYQVRLSPQGTS